MPACLPMPATTVYNHRSGCSVDAAWEVVEPLGDVSGNFNINIRANLTTEQHCAMAAENW